MQPLNSSKQASSSRSASHRTGKAIEIKKTQDIQEKDVSSSVMKLSLSEIFDFNEAIIEYQEKLLMLRVGLAISLDEIKLCIKGEASKPWGHNNYDEIAQNICDEKWFDFSVAEKKEKNFTPEFEQHFRGYIKKLQIFNEALQSTKEVIKNIGKNLKLQIPELELEDSEKNIELEKSQKKISLNEDLEEVYEKFFSIQSNMAHSIVDVSQSFAPLSEDSEHSRKCQSLNNICQNIINDVQKIHDEAKKYFPKEIIGELNIEHNLLEFRKAYKYQKMQDARSEEFTKLEKSIHATLEAIVGLDNDWSEIFQKIKKKPSKNEANVLYLKKNKELSGIIKKIENKIRFLRAKNILRYQNIVDFLQQYHSFLQKYDEVFLMGDDKTYKEECNNFEKLKEEYTKKLKEHKEYFADLLTAYPQKNIVRQFFWGDVKEMETKLQELSEQIQDEIITFLTQDDKPKQQSLLSVPLSSKQKFISEIEQDNIESPENIIETGTSSKQLPEEQYNQKLQAQWQNYFKHTDYREGNWHSKGGILIPLMENNFPPQMQFMLSAHTVMAHLKKRHPDVAQALSEMKKKTIEDKDGFKPVISEYKQDIHNLIFELAFQLSQKETLIYKSSFHKDAETGEKIDNPTIMLKGKNEAGETMLSAWGLYEVEKQDGIKLHLLSYYKEDRSDEQVPINTSKPTSSSKGKGKKILKKPMSTETKISQFAEDVAQEIKEKALLKSFEEMDVQKKVAEEKFDAIKKSKGKKKKS